MNKKQMGEILEALNVVSVGVAKLAEMRTDRKQVERIQKMAEQVSCKIAAIGYSPEEDIPRHTEMFASGHARALEGLSAVLDLISSPQSKSAEAPSGLGTPAIGYGDASPSSSKKAFRPVRC